MGLTQEEITLGASVLKEKDLVPINRLDLELASMFTITEYFRHLTNLKNSRYLFFSKALWPLYLVQVGLEHYIAIDGLNFYSLRFQITDAPSTIQSKISRLMRDASGKSPEEQDLVSILDECKELIEGIEKPEIFIKGVVDPDLLKGITTLLKSEESNPSSLLASLDSVYTSDQAIEIANEFSNVLKQIDGNIQSWKILLNLIEDTTDDWLIRIKRKLEDREKRFNIEIHKKQTDAKTQFEVLKKQKSDEQYNLTEWFSKRNQSLTISIHEVHQRLISYLNEYGLRVSDLKKEEPEPAIVLQKVRDSVKELKEGKDLRELISSMEEEFLRIESELTNLTKERQEREEEIEKRYHDLYQKVGANLPEMSSSKDSVLEGLETARDSIDEKTETIKKIIKKTIDDCTNEKNYLLRWAVLGSQINMVVPFAKKFIPLYVAELETPDEEEIFIINPPIILFSKKTSGDQWIPFDYVNAAFKSTLKDKLEKALETNFEIRSNFEFNCDKKNLFLNEDISKRRIQRGFDLLVTKNLIEESRINEIRNTWTKSIQGLTKSDKGDSD